MDEIEVENPDMPGKAPIREKGRTQDRKR